MLDRFGITPVEIKSAETFSLDFIKGVERFQSLDIKRVTNGAVLYNGEQPFNVRGVRILNPLLVESIWEILTASPDPGA
ncbi:MAG: hypothetical protein A2511_05385 [Deltaproteobacteria bacterium RIFOXYD12_FULL_50_9]|nr:MAG: hypothetical protein A2511_05385 [Deltaproteobacteria bacterium RIFOXYD12_FULL_50_9]